MKKFMCPWLIAVAGVVLAVAGCKGSYGSISIATQVLPTAKVALSYWGKVRVAGGTAPYTVTVGSGALPDGLSIDAGGIISGTPAASPGQFTFTLMISDSSQPVATAISRSLTIMVKPLIAGSAGGGDGYGNIIQADDCDVVLADENHDSFDDAYPDQTVLQRVRDLLLSKQGADDITGEGCYMICLEDSVDIDLTNEEPLFIKSGVTLAGFRGAPDGSGGYKTGGRIFSREERAGGIIKLADPSVRLTGLRIEGPGPYYLPDYIWDEDLDDYVLKASYTTAGARGVLIEGEGPAEVDNCRIYNWSYAGIYIRSAGGTQPYIHHNRIYDCRGALGYGVEVRDSQPLIDNNIFALCRHAIAGVGISNNNPPASFEASYNQVVSGYCGYRVDGEGRHVPVPAPHCFDMHGNFPNTGTGVAGEWLLIHANAFEWTEGLAISVRGFPQECSEIYRNFFHHDDINLAVRQNRLWYQSIHATNVHVENNYILKDGFEDQSVWSNIVLIQ